jgi:NhaP-type Na+/H+ or K+/H+ antiporter
MLTFIGGVALGLVIGAVAVWLLIIWVLDGAWH